METKQTTSEPRGSQYTQSGISPPATNTVAADRARAELKAAIKLHEVAHELRRMGSIGASHVTFDAQACHNRALEAIKHEYGERVARLIPAPTGSRDDADVAREALRVVDEHCGMSYCYEVQPIVTKLAGDPATLRQVVALLGVFGVKRGQDVAAEDLPAFKAALEAIYHGEVL